MSNKNLHRIARLDTDKRHNISTKSQGICQTPQDIMKEYNRCSVPQYTAYSLLGWLSSGPPLHTRLFNWFQGVVYVASVPSAMTRFSFRPLASSSAIVGPIAQLPATRKSIPMRAVLLPLGHSLNRPSCHLAESCRARARLRLSGMEA